MSDSLRNPMMSIIFLSIQKALNEALEKCPNDHPYNITCTQLDAIAEDVNKLSYALQSNPQEFGQQILVLQTQLSDLRAKLRQKMHQPEVEATIKKVSLQLEMRLIL